MARPEAVAAARVAVRVFPWVNIPVPGGRSYSLPVIMVAIAGAESGWNPTAAGDAGYTDRPCCNVPGKGCCTSFGLWQINTIHSWLAEPGFANSSDPCVWANWLYNPYNNAIAAMELLHGDLLSGLNNWSVWKDRYGRSGYGVYLNYLDEAKEAVDEALKEQSGGWGWDLGRILSYVPAYMVVAVMGMFIAGSALIGAGIAKKRW